MHSQKGCALMFVIFESLNQGGWVIWALLFLCIIIWSKYCSTYCIYSTESDLFKKKKKLFEHTSDVKKKDCLELIKTSLNREERLLKSFIAVAPLLGLLGTVGGMIETFSSLETMEMFKPGGGISVGISQALLTTQLGLIVAVPALLTLRLLDKRKTKFLEQLEISIRRKQ